MTVQELMELLKDVKPEAEVRLATQPSWPLAFRVRGVALQSEIDVNEAYTALERGDVDEHTQTYGIDEEKVRADAEAIVWIVEGGQCDHPYAPSGVWDAVTLG